MEAFFHSVPDGQRLYVLQVPAGSPVGAVMFVHGFAEELNKARRMVALQSRSLAAAGWFVLQVDLKGCGDSSGDFGDASWADWLQDVHQAVDWLSTRTGLPVWLWGLRAGALLAAECLQGSVRCAGLLLWQPAHSGKTLLQQFLRLQMATALRDGAARGVVEGLRRDLAAGLTVEVGGYRLDPALASGLDASMLSPPRSAGRAIWLEVSARNEPSFSPASATSLERWREAGWSVDAQVVNGPAFWQTTEIQEVPALIDVTTSALGGRLPK